MRRAGSLAKHSLEVTSRMKLGSHQIDFLMLGTTLGHWVQHCTVYYTDKKSIKRYPKLRNMIVLGLVCSMLSSNLGAFLLILRSACGSSWKLSASRASRALRCLRLRAAASRTRLCWTSFTRPAIRQGLAKLPSLDNQLLYFVLRVCDPLTESS